MQNYLLQHFFPKTKKWQQIVNLIKEHQKIWIFGHTNPDGDCLGAQSALKQMIQLNFRQKQVYAPIIKSEKPNKWIFPTFPADLAPQADDLKTGLIILVDLNSVVRTDFEQLKTAQKIVIIDHHVSNSITNPNVIATWINPKFSSACEMLATWFYCQNWKMNRNLSNALLTGIITDTGNLKFSSTQSQTMFLVGWLMKKKAQLPLIHEKISYLNEKDLVTFRYFQDHFTDEQELKYFTFKAEELKTLPWIKETHQFKRYLIFLKNIINTKVYATFIQLELNGTIHCSLRSKKTNINQIAQKFGGGGHKFASGIKLKTWTEVNELIFEIKKLLKTS